MVWRGLATACAALLGACATAPSRSSQRNSGRGPYDGVTGSSTRCVGRLPVIDARPDLRSERPRIVCCAAVRGRTKSGGHGFLRGA